MLVEQVREDVLNERLFHNQVRIMFWNLNRAYERPMNENRVTKMKNVENSFQWKIFLTRCSRSVICSSELLRNLTSFERVRTALSDESNERLASSSTE